VGSTAAWADALHLLMLLQAVLVAGGARRRAFAQVAGLEALLTQVSARVASTMRLVQDAAAALHDACKQDKDLLDMRLAGAGAQLPALPGALQPADDAHCAASDAAEVFAPFSTRTAGRRCRRGAAAADKVRGHRRGGGDACWRCEERGKSCCAHRAL
jgi:hypothetical protein